MERSPASYSAHPDNAASMPATSRTARRRRRWREVMSATKRERTPENKQTPKRILPSCQAFPHSAAMEALLSNTVCARAAAPVAARGNARAAALSSRPAKFIAAKSAVSLSARSARSPAVCAAAPEPAPAQEGSDPSKMGVNMVRGIQTVNQAPDMSCAERRPPRRAWAQAESPSLRPLCSPPFSTSTRS